MTGRVTIMVALTLLGTSSFAEDRRVPESRQEKLSYAFGMEAGANLRRYSLEVDTDLLLQGLEDALAGGKTLLSEAEARKLIADLQTELKRQGSQTAQGGTAGSNLAEKNRQEGEAFLAENKGRPGVVVLDSGLQYRILKAGQGARPAIADVVITHYRGTLIDGREFDNSLARSQPATFRVNGVIKGWSEALQLMPVGSRWQIFVPPDLAYGARGAGPLIGPYSTLIFEVELLGIGTMGGGLDSASRAAPPTLADLRFSYRLDPRLTRGLYMGDRWLSTPTFTGIAGQKMVRARAEGLDAQGKPVAVNPKWSPSDVGMVTVTPTEGNEVEITVKRAGRSIVRVTVDGVMSELVIRAEQEGESLKLQIAKS